MSPAIVAAIVFYALGGIAVAFISPFLWRQFKAFHLLPIAYGVLGSVLFHWLGLIHNLTVPNLLVLATGFYALAWVSTLENLRGRK